MSVLKCEKVGLGSYECEIDLDELFQGDKNRELFEKKWEEFMISDKWNQAVINRAGNKIIYSHKSWIPEKETLRPKLLIIGGNPASHSVSKDLYYAFEGNGSEHRFWRVLRELNIIDLDYDLLKMRDRFFRLQYKSPFLVAIEDIITFPSSASAPKWSGVQGVIKLFGNKAFNKLYIEEKLRLKELAKDFFAKDGGIIIAMQKHAYETFASNLYSVDKAMEGILFDDFGNGVKIYGTPPTRWLYTKKTKDTLQKITVDYI